MHLTLDLCLLALDGEIPVETLLGSAHRHLLQTCGVCRGEWEAVAESCSEPLWSPPPPQAVVLAELPSDRRELSLGHLEELTSTLSALREQGRKAREDLGRLLALPAEERRRRIETATSRFRSRALAVLLLQESRRRARTNPRKAAHLAELVPAVLAWTPGAGGRAWTEDLHVLSLAHRANALRIAGDLPAADRLFASLRDRLAASSSSGTFIETEIDSLEASLRIGQRRFGDAEVILKRAVDLALRAPDADLGSRLLIKHGNLLRNLGRPGEALQRFRQALSLVEETQSSGLALSAIAGQVNSLCDLDLAREAGALLATQRHSFERSHDPFVVPGLAGLEGRILLGVGRRDEAAEAFRRCSDGFLALGRPYDAALVSLDLAQVLLEDGRTAELRKLAKRLVVEFQARGVAREALAALRLLAQAVAAERLTSAVIREVRQRLEAHGGAPVPGRPML